MTTLATAPAPCQTDPAAVRRQRLLDLVPLVWANIEAGDVFSDTGRERLERASRWLRRNDLTMAK